MSRMSDNIYVDSKDAVSLFSRTKSSSPIPHCAVLLHCNSSSTKRASRRHLSSKVPLYLPYRRDRETLHHALSMPSISPAPPIRDRNTLAHSASDVPFIVLDEADKFLCDNKRKQGLTLDDLEFVQLIGTGMYSKVYLVQTKDITKDYFALKVIPKYKIKNKKSKSEADIMLSLDHPLIVKTWSSFEDEENMYILMEFATGGELFYHLRGRGRFDEDTARFYAAEVVLAIEYMHNSNIAFRDLKLENVVLSDRGHIQVTDFGFAKHMDDVRTYTLCGTPEYLAPEIVRGAGYGLPVDWWALGVLLFEMIAGYSPFYSDTPLEIYKNILRGSVRFSSCMSEPAKDLLKGLLTRSPSQRLGVIRNGVSELRSHPFFAGIDWDTLTTKTPPIVPNISGKGDTKYFNVDDGADGADGADTDEKCGADVLNSSASSDERGSTEETAASASESDADGSFEGF